jgi:hypothetical protein
MALFDPSTVGGLLQPVTAARVSGSGQPGDLELMYWTISKIPWLCIITTGQGTYHARDGFQHRTTRQRLLDRV